MRRTLFEPDALADGRAEHAAAEDLRDGLLHIAGQGRALVVQRDHRAQQLEVGIGPRPDLFDRLQEVVGALEREVARLDRDQQVGGRDQRVDGDETERGRRVDHDELVSIGHEVEAILQPEVRVDLADELRLELGQGDPRRRHVEVGDGRRRDHVAERRAVGEHVEHRFRKRAHVEVADRRIGLRIEIDEERTPAALREGRGQVDGGRGLAHSALLIGDGDDDQRMPPFPMPGRASTRRDERSRTAGNIGTIGILGKGVSQGQG